MAKKLKLGSWEGQPTALVIDERDGTMEGYLWTGFGWNPGYTEEAFTKSAELTPERFAEAFPGVKPPTI